jgi:recombination associated protein RdgC
MQLVDRAGNGEYLGREFLVWLWFKTETREGRFDLGEQGVAELWFDRRVVLQSESDEGTEKIVCTGDNPHLREARFALTEKKQIVEAMIKLTIGDHTWSFVLESKWMNFKGFKTPRVLQDKNEDPDGLFYEKFLLIDQALKAVDAVFAAFIKVRSSPEWEAEEVPALLKWIDEGR